MSNFKTPRSECGATRTECRFSLECAKYDPVRARLYDYHFASWSEHRGSGAWWKREERGDYLPAVSLENFERR